MKNKKTLKLTSEVKEAIKTHAPNDKRSLRKLQEFVQEMSSKGLIKKREYDIPLADTIGKTIFQHEP